MRPLIVLLPLLLAACGSLPQPFFGNPGLAGSRLAEPPPSRLAIPSPDQSLLPDAQAHAWAQAVAAALVEQEVPAEASDRRRNREWTLILAAEMRGADVVPSYTVQNPAGEPQGVSEAPAIPARDWASGNPEVLKAAAAQAAPGITSLLNRIEAARRQSDPNSLLNRPARVYFTGVTGAPGDGNRSLPTQMRAKLAAAGLVVQDTATNADYTLAGEVRTANGANGTVRVELQWIVADAKGERGRVVQINEVPPASVNSYWGDVAVAVADEAATGVHDVITNAGGATGPAQAGTAPPR